MKLLKYLYLAIVLLTISCKKEPITSNYKELRLSSEKYQYNIFEEADLVLKVGKEGLYDFDSITWDVLDVKVPVRESIGITQNFVFSLPGNYQISVNGWRDGLIVKFVSREIEVVAKKDFLNINWNEKEPIYNVISVNHTKNYDLRFHFEPNGHKKAPFAAILLNPYKRYGINYYNKFEREELSNYVKKLYGDSKFKFEGSDPKLTNLREIYKSNFIYADPYKYPIEIWETNTTKIVLYAEFTYIQSQTQEDPFYFYYLLAEPLN